MSGRQLSIISVFGLGGLLVVLLFIVVQPFPVFNFISDAIIPTFSLIDDNVWLHVSQVLWTERQIDLVVLGLLLFVTAGCCRFLYQT